MSLTVEIAPVKRQGRKRCYWQWQFVWNGSPFVSPLTFATPKEAKEDLGRLILAFRADDFPVQVTR